MSTDAATADAIDAAAPTGPAEPTPLQQWGQRLDGWLDRASDYLNPILVKETRQALKSRQFVLWYLMLLAGCWIVTIGGIAVIGPAAYYAAAGGVLFQWYFGMLMFPLLVVVPFSAFRSLASEQEDNTRDVLTVSALSPYQLINGKLGSAMLQMTVYLSAIAPCLGFTYLLRGIDAPTILLLPILGVLASLGLSLIGLLLASASPQRYIQIVLSVAMVAGLLWVFGMSIPLCNSFVTEGFRMYQDREFWTVLGAILTTFATTFLIFYCLAAGANTFTSANRSTALRLALLFQQACFVGWWAALLIEFPESEGAMIFGAIAGAYWAFIGMFATGEGPVLSPRVRRTLPATSLTRLLFTWTTPGPGTGYLFVVANLTLCLCLVFVGLLWTDAAFGTRTLGYLGAIALFYAYIVGYLGMGRIAIGFAKRFAEVSMLGSFLINFLIVLAGSAIPPVIKASSRAIRRADFLFWETPSPFAVLTQYNRMSDADTIFVGVVVGGCALCMLLVNLALTAREIRQSRIAAPRRVIEDELILHPAPGPKQSNPWGDTQPVDA